MPLFSIVIPTHNRATHLPVAIRSVIAQTYSDWELIVVDDGSTDDTQLVVHPFVAEDSRIHYHWQTNRELSGARNVGVDLARGTWIAFLDDDDYFLPNHLQVLADHLEEHPFTNQIVRTGTILQLGARQKFLPLFASDRENRFEFVWYKPVNLLSAVFPREVFEEHRFPEEFLLYEDHHFLHRILLDRALIQLSPYTVVYVNHQHCRTNIYTSEDILRNKLQAMDDLFAQAGDRLRPYISDAMRRDLVSSEFLHFANVSTHRRAFGRSVRFIGRALRNGLSYRLLHPLLYSVVLLVSKRLFNFPKTFDAPSGAPNATAPASNNS